jgi:cobalt/nickel transport protein
MMDNKTFIIVGVIIALLIGVVAVFMASSDPDGLESTALVVQGQKQLTGATPPDAEINEDLTGKFSYSSPMPDYSLGNALGSTGGAIAIIGGTIIAFLVVLGIAYGIKVARKPAKENP